MCSLFTIIMVTSSHQCYIECRFLHNHTYSMKKDITVDGSFLGSSFDPIRKYKICMKLYIILYQSNTMKKQTASNEVISNPSSSPHPIRESMSNLSSTIKCQYRSNKDVLKDLIKEHHYRQQLRNAYFERRVKSIIPIASHILAAVIDIDQFLIDGFNYLEEN